MTPLQRVVVVAGVAIMAYFVAISPPRAVNGPDGRQSPDEICRVIESTQETEDRWTWDGCISMATSRSFLDLPLMAIYAAATVFGTAALVWALRPLRNAR